MSSAVKSVIFFVAGASCAALLWGSLAGRGQSEVSFAQFMTDVERGSVREVSVEGNQVRGLHRDGSRFRTAMPANYPAMMKRLRDNGVSITFREANFGSWVWLIQLIPLAFVATVTYAIPAAFVAGLVFLVTSAVSRQRSCFGELNR